MARPELKPVIDFCKENGFEIKPNDPLQQTFTIRKKRGVEVKPVCMIRVPEIEGNVYLFSFEIGGGAKPDYSHHHFLAKELASYINRDKENEAKRKFFESMAKKI